MRVANLFLYFFVHLRKIRQFLIGEINSRYEIDENPTNLCQVRKSPPLIEGLRVIFPPFSDFQGRTGWF